VRRKFLRTLLVIWPLATLAPLPATAGQINVAWDPVAGASGYHVYYGTNSATYEKNVTTTTNAVTIDGLQDCKNYFVAVKAFNAAGESPNFSNELSGWSRPGVTSATPANAMQGDQIVMDITGANFQTGAVVDLGNPQVVLTAVSVVSCNHIQLIATVEPTATGVHPAQIGALDLTVANSDSTFGTKSAAFEVRINPARFDVNQSDATTRNRIDGKDTVYVSRNFAMNQQNANYDPDDDFDGNGWVDGDDLAYIATNFGRCWSSATKSWSLSACPAGQ
jgi:hypothetical protein